VATEVIMPALGVSQDTGRVVRWLKVDGDEVASGEPLVEIETDKVTVELEAPASGVLGAVRAGEGEDVPVGDVIGLILAPGEAPPAVPARASGAAASRAVASEQRPAPTLPAAPAAAARPRSSPLARKRAREAGLDLRAVAGTGPNGAVTAADVTAAASGRPVAGAPPAPSPTSAVWRRMVEHVSASWAAPHFALARDVDARRLVAWRTSLGEEVTVTDLLVWLAARALARHPEVNARWEHDAVARLPDVNVGIAVAFDGGLVVPVVHGADRLGVREVAGRRRELVTRARDGALRPEDVQDGTFTVSNLGMFGVDAFTAIVNGPQAAILAVGRVADRVVAEDGRPAVRPGMTVTLSCDHRVVDGAMAARFLGTFVELAEEPLALLA
jgi:pyruvate dehydrogenase E2 component (dihydrolipoamide acetyltransferase)